MSGLEQKDVLIVDDDESIRTLLRRTLERAGLSCAVATDGVDATERIRRDDYALVLLDLMMPRLDGVGFVQCLREAQKRRGFRPVVLMMTAAPERHDLAATGDMVQAIVAKPFDIHDIAGLCHDCVEARRAYQA